MPTAKKATRKKPGVKSRVKAKKKRVIKSTAVKASNRNFASAVSLATDVIYEAGEKGRKKPTWGQALRAVHGNGSLSGTRRRR